MKTTELKPVLLDAVNEMISTRIEAFKKEGNIEVQGRDFELFTNVTFEYHTEGKLMGVASEFELVTFSNKEHKLNVVLKSFVKKEHDECSYVGVASGVCGKDFDVYRDEEDESTSLTVDIETEDQALMGLLGEIGFFDEERVIEGDLLNLILDFAEASNRAESDRYILLPENILNGVRVFNRHKTIRTMTYPNGTLYIAESARLEDELERYAPTYQHKKQEDLNELLQEKTKQLVALLNETFERHSGKLKKPISIKEGECVGSGVYVNYPYLENEWTLTLDGLYEDESFSLELYTEFTNTIYEQKDFNTLYFSVEETVDEWRDFKSAVVKELRESNQINQVLNDVYQIDMVLKDRVFTQDVVKNIDGGKEFIEYIIGSDNSVAYMISAGGYVFPIVNENIIADWLE